MEFSVLAALNFETVESNFLWTHSSSAPQTAPLAAPCIDAAGNQHRHADDASVHTDFFVECIRPYDRIVPC